MSFLQENRKLLTIGSRLFFLYTLGSKRRDKMLTYVNFLMRIILSIIVGFFIGWETQATGHIVGIRINVLICMGTCLFTLFPILNGSTEVFRTSSSIISGVGFLCSGVIFKENGFVRGMNTAGTLWCTAAIGILCSMEQWEYAVMASIILIFSNLLLRPLSMKLSAPGIQSEMDRRYQISIIGQEAAELEIRSALLNLNMSKTLFLDHLESCDVIGGKVEVQAQFVSSRKSESHVLEQIVRKILENPSVSTAGWEIL